MAFEEMFTEFSDTYTRFLNSGILPSISITYILPIPIICLLDLSHSPLASQIPVLIDLSNYWGPS